MAHCGSPLSLITSIRTRQLGGSRARGRKRAVGDELDNLNPGCESFSYSKRGLQTFPFEILPILINIKFCYLDENLLTCLPEVLFEVLPQLEWLDLRRNSLQALPTAGLEGHPRLQVLLLQSNRLRNLPLQLAALPLCTLFLKVSVVRPLTPLSPAPSAANQVRENTRAAVPHLKGLQIAGNPIENVPFETQAAGLPAVVKFLRKLSKQPSTILPVSETIITNPCQQDPTNSDVNGSHENRTRNIITGKACKKSLPVNQSLEGTLNVKSYHKGSEDAVKKTTNGNQRLMGKVMVVQTHVSSACQRLSRQRTSSIKTNKLVSVEKVAIREKDESERDKLRETLERQSQMLQRIKDMEAVKSWRKVFVTEGPRKLLDNFQYSPSRNFHDKTPFDVDADMLRMLSRADLYKSLKQWEDHHRRLALKHQTKSIGTSVSDVETHIGDIRRRLEQINVDKQLQNSTKDKKYHLTTRIDEINKLRQILIKLHGENLCVKD